MLKGIFTWLNASQDRNGLLGMLLQHVDFKSLSDDWHREVGAALRKRAQSSQPFQPKRRRLQHWSPDLGASEISEASGYEVLPFACNCLRRHGGDIYATDYVNGRTLCWKHGDAATSMRTLVDAGAEVCGMNLETECDISISPSGELFVADYFNYRLVNLDLLFVSPSGAVRGGAGGANAAEAGFSTSDSGCLRESSCRPAVQSKSHVCDQRRGDLSF